MSSAGETQAAAGAADQLLTYAAADFHASRPADPGRFREVRLGHVETSGGAEQAMLCGQFLATQGGGEVKWVQFATIETSGYEQWNGARAAGFCQDPAVVWAEGGDLSQSLQRRVDSLRQGAG